MLSPRVLVVDSEPPEERQKRREHGRPTACGSFIKTLQKLLPGLICDRLAPIEGYPTPAVDYTTYNGVFFSGSPLHFYDDSAEVSNVLAFSGRLFNTGLPCFGSCAGLQIAAIIAGGVVGPKKRQTELGISRAIMPTADGLRHPMFCGRPRVFDASSIHGDEVQSLPVGATLLATSEATPVQAVEMRVGQSVFWGTQYHPEVSLEEIAYALRDQAGVAIEQGFARDRSQLEKQLAKYVALDQEPDRLDLRWELGLDRQVICFDERTVELRNFVRQFVDNSVDGMAS